MSNSPKFRSLRLKPSGLPYIEMRASSSKVALMALVERLGAGGCVLFDVQWTTDHLVSLGAVDVERVRYLEVLADALDRPQLQLG